MKFEKGNPQPDPRLRPIAGMSRADMRYWMRWFEKIEPELTSSQKLAYIRAVTVALIQVCKPAGAVEAQRKYNEKKAKTLLDAVVAKRRLVGVTTGVKPEAPTTGITPRREAPPENPPQSA